MLFRVDELKVFTEEELVERALRENFEVHFHRRPLISSSSPWFLD